jgi:hypothetical protein
LPVLARKVIPLISNESLGLRMREITRLSPIKKNGFDAKAKGAVLVARRRYGCDGLVIVSDRDAKDNEARLEKLRCCESLAATEGIRVVCGLAVESIESWTLGAPQAIAQVLDFEERVVRGAYPKAHVETLLTSSGKEEHRAKALVRRLALLGHREDGQDFRREVAELTDVVALERDCPTGFGAFAVSLRAAFGEQKSDD